MDTPESDKPAVKKGLIYADPEKNRAALLGIFAGVAVAVIATVYFRLLFALYMDEALIQLFYFLFFSLLPGMVGGVTGRRWGTSGSIVLGCVFAALGAGFVFYIQLNGCLFCRKLLTIIT